MKAENHVAAKLAVGLILLSAFGIGSCYWGRNVVVQRDHRE